MYCIRCGAPNDDSASFCLQCGASLPGTGDASVPQTAQTDGSPVWAREPDEPAAWTPEPEEYTGWSDEGEAYGAPRPVGSQVQSPPPRKGASRWLVACGALVLAGIVVCVALAVGAYFFLGLNRSNQTSKIVPADTPLLMSFSPNPLQAAQIRNAENLEALLPVLGAVPGLQEAAGEVQRGFVSELDVDFQQDIAPWIGLEAGVAILDMEPEDRGDVPPMVLTLATRDEEKSDAFLDKVRRDMERDGLQFEEEIYKGTPVMYSVPDYEGALAPAFATFSDMVVVGTDREALHQVVDAAASGGDAVLAKEDSYKDTLKALPGNRLGYVYLDGETLWKDLEHELDLPVELDAVQGVGVSFSLVDDGVRLDYVLSLDVDRLTSDQQRALDRSKNSLKTAELVPEGAVGFLSGQDLMSNYELIMSSLTDTEDLEDALDEIEDEFDIDLIDDLLRHLDGEYALAVLPDSSGLLGDSQVRVGMVLLAETSDPDKVDANLEEVVDRLADRAGVESGREKIGGVNFIVLEDSWGWYLAYGFVDQFLVVGTSEDMLKAVVRGLDNPLADGGVFQRVTRALPGRTDTLLWVDMDQAIRIARKSMGEWDRDEFDEEVRPYLEPIEAVGFGTEPLDRSGNWRGTLFLYTGQ